MKALIEQYEKKLNALSIQYGYPDIQLQVILIEDTIPHYQIGLEIGEHIFTVGVFSYEEAQNQFDKLYDEVLLFLRKIKLEIIDEEVKGDAVFVEYAYDYELISAPNHNIIIHKDAYVEFLEDRDNVRFTDDEITFEWLTAEDEDFVAYIKYHLKNNYLLNVK